VAPAVFWLGIAFLAYPYVGYPLWLALRLLVAPRRAVQEGVGPAPSVSVVLAVRNEAGRIASRIENLLAQHYADAPLDIWVVSDGSTDGTDEVVAGIARERLAVHLIPNPAAGKAAAINAAVERARGEILVFADARQEFAPDAIRRLVETSRDPGVGAVSGRLTLRRRGAGTRLGVEEYWRLESWIRRAEGELGSVVGVTGAVWAARRAPFPRLPPGTLLDDVYAPMRLALDGWRVAYAPDAVAYDLESATPREEFRRKVRTLTGNYQLLRLLPDLLRPGRNPLFFRFVSHKLARLASPLCLVAVLGASLFLDGPVYRAALALQALFYGCAVLGLVSARARRHAVARVPGAFLLLNAAAAAAFGNWVRGRLDAPWAAS